MALAAPCKGTREICACGIRIPGIWKQNTAQGIWNPTNVCSMSRLESSTWNPESMAWNP